LHHNPSDARLPGTPLILRTVSLGVPAISKTQIDQLGDRLRQGPVTEADLRLLDAFRRSFSSAYDHVVDVIRHELSLEPTGRPAKSTTSIIEKLRRETTRLSQMQDIAGCRLVVTDVLAQERVVAQLVKTFQASTVVDRRKHPSHGYRAVHVVAHVAQQAIEIQIRTALQHLWAELSEKLSDVIDPGIKYGGGNEQALTLLRSATAFIGQIEVLELVPPTPGSPSDVQGMKQELARSLESMIAEWAQIRRHRYGLSD